VARHKAARLNTALKLMLVVSGLFVFAFGMFTPLYAIFVKDIGGDITTASSAWAVFSLVAGLTTFITGSWENKIKETEIGIVWSQFIIGLAYTFYYFTDFFSNGILMLYLAQAILGLGMAFFWPAFHAVYAKHVEPTKSAWQWSLYDGLAYLTPAIAAVLGGWLVKHYGFDVVFLIMAVLSYICGLFIWILPRKLL